eukprot:Colp12_sorted_trinity150504_noHs@5754
MFIQARFKVRHFVTNLLYLNTETSKRLHFMYLRQLFLEGFFGVDEDTAFKLAGILLQKDFGDYKEEMGSLDYIVAPYFLPARTIDGTQSNVIDMLRHQHQNVTKYAKENPQKAFLKLVQGLPEYGFLFYKARDETRDVHYVGLNAHGVGLFSETAGVKRQIRHIGWVPSPPAVEPDKSRAVILYGEERIVLNTPSVKSAEYLCRLFKEAFEFFVFEFRRVERIRKELGLPPTSQVD